MLDSPFCGKNPNKGELRDTAINHSSDISIKDFIDTYKEFTGKPYSFLVNDTTLALDDLLRFRKIIFKYNKNHDN